MSIPGWQRISGAGEKPDLSPSEVERLIRRHASPQSLLGYEEAIASRIIRQVAEEIERFGKGFARCRETDTVATYSGVPDAIDEIADIVASSTFPTRLISLEKGEC